MTARRITAKMRMGTGAPRLGQAKKSDFLDPDRWTISPQSTFSTVGYLPAAMRKERESGKLVEQAACCAGHFRLDWD
jgi:hypothetical protein